MATYTLRLLLEIYKVHVNVPCCYQAINVSTSSSAACQRSANLFGIK